MGHRRQRAPRRLTARSAISLVLGVLVLLSPVALTHWSNIEQQRVAEAYSLDAARLDDAELARDLEAARDYNAQLAQAPTSDPWGSAPDASSPEYRRYLSLLDLGGVMARVRLPSVGIDAPVYHGTDQSTLAVGVGHVYGSALPVGGAGTHTVLAGHTGLATATLFDNLSHAAVGDLVLVEVLGQTIAYRVDLVQTVLPTELDAVRPEAGRELLTLVTCTPYGINTHRLLVRAERVEVPAEPPAQSYFTPWQPWMIATVIVAVAALGYLVWWWLRRRRDRQKGASE